MGKLHVFKFETTGPAVAGAAGSNQVWGIDFGQLVNGKRDPTDLVRIHCIEFIPRRWERDIFGADASDFATFQDVRFTLANRELSAAEMDDSLATGLTLGNSAVVDQWSLGAITAQVNPVAPAVNDSISFFAYPVNEPYKRFLGWRGAGELFNSSRAVLHVENRGNAGQTFDDTRWGYKVWYSMEKISEKNLITLLASLQEYPVFETSV